MVESEERFCGKEGVEVDTRDDVSGVKKSFPGVDKRGDKWRARVRNPLLKADVHLGYYETPEEAALVVIKKKAEFKEMFTNQESLSMGTCRSYFEGKKVPWGWGVRRQYRRNRAHICHSKLKSWVSGSCNRTCEEAAIVADKQREEFQEMYVPPGVRRIQSGKWVARIKKPDSKDRIWLGTYNTLEEAISSFDKKKAEFDAKLKSPEFDCAEFRPVSEASESQDNVALVDNSSCDYRVVDIPGKLGDELAHRSPTSVFDPMNTNTASVGDKTFDSEFDRAVSLGIINEYGHLLGKYSESDTQTWLSSTEEMLWILPIP